MNINKFFDSWKTTEAITLSNPKYTNFKVLIIKIDGMILTPYFTMYDNGESKGAFYFSDQDNRCPNWKKVNIPKNLQHIYLCRYFDYYQRRDYMEKKKSQKRKTKGEKKLDNKIEIVDNITKIDIKPIINDSKEVKKTKEKTIVRKFPTGIKGVNFHYPFGPSSKLTSLHGESFAFRARRSYTNKDKKKIYVKAGDHPLTETGLITGAFALDTKIIRENHPLSKIFNNDDYNFIDKYGVEHWIIITGFKSIFEYNESRKEIILRYFNIEEDQAIKDSYPKIYTYSSFSDLIHYSQIEPETKQAFDKKYNNGFTPAYEKN